MSTVIFDGMWMSDDPNSQIQLNQKKADGSPITHKHFFRFVYSKLDGKTKIGKIYYDYNLFADNECIGTATFINLDDHDSFSFPIHWNKDFFKGDEKFSTVSVGRGDIVFENGRYNKYHDKVLVETYSLSNNTTFYIKVSTFAL
jgi:hypothetical protein